MTMSVINYTDKFCKIYGKSILNNDELFGNIIIKKTNNLLLSIEKDINKLKLKEDNITEKDIEDIIKILTKLSFISRVNFIKCIDNIKRNDLDIKNSKYITDCILKDIIRILFKSDSNMSIYSINNFFKNDIISHTNRVFFTIIKFIKFYNNKIDNNIVHDIKLNFRKKYSKYYKSVFKKFNINNKADKLENVYKYGLREIFIKEIIDIAIASFWHDIANISLNLLSDHYYNIVDGYYVSRAYSYLKYFMNYSDNISLIVGTHNEYFGNGNGVFLEYYNIVNNSEFFSNPNHIISFDYDDILKLNSISYFPSKILEIVDLFDNVVYIDTKLDCNKALEHIKENYLCKEVKIDPIIFDIFSSFIYSDNKLIA